MEFPAADPLAAPTPVALTSLHIHLPSEMRVTEFPPVTAPAQVGNEAAASITLSTLHIHLPTEMRVRDFHTYIHESGGIIREVDVVPHVAGAPRPPLDMFLCRKCALEERFTKISLARENDYNFYFNGNKVLLDNVENVIVCASFSPKNGLVISQCFCEFCYSTMGFHYEAIDATAGDDDKLKYFIELDSILWYVAADRAYKDPRFPDIQIDVPLDAPPVAPPVATGSQVGSLHIHIPTEINVNNHTFIGTDAPPRE